MTSNTPIALNGTNVRSPSNLMHSFPTLRNVSMLKSTSLCGYKLRLTIATNPSLHVVYTLEELLSTEGSIAIGTGYFSFGGKTRSVRTAPKRFSPPLKIGMLLRGTSCADVCFCSPSCPSRSKDSRNVSGLTYCAGSNASSIALVFVGSEATPHFVRRTKVASTSGCEMSRPRKKIVLSTI